MPGKPVADWLQLGLESGPLARQAARHMALQRRYAQLVPAAMSAMSHVAALRGGTLHLVAMNGAVATKLKQIAPTLVAQIRERDHEVNRIQVTVQGSVAVGAPAPRKRARLPAEALPAIEALAASVSDPALREALDRMVRRHRSGSDGLP